MSNCGVVATYSSIPGTVAWQCARARQAQPNPQGRSARASISSPPGISTSRTGYTMRKLFFAAVFGMCLGSSLPAAAQTISFAEGYDRLAKGCGRDIEKLCGNVTLGGGAVRACLEKNRATLSAGCRATQAETFALLTKRLQAQATAVQVCDRDRGQYCRGV